MTHLVSICHHLPHKKGSPNHDYILQMARNARYEPAPDLWDLSFSQLAGYLGPDQRVSERVSK